MKFRTDIKNEKRNNILVILFIVLFFTGAKLLSQTADLARKTYFNFDLNKEATLLFPNEGLVFITEGKLDTVYLSIIADSINDTRYEIKLYTFLPKTKKFEGVRSVVIEFEDGYTFAYETSRIESVEGYREYNLSKPSFNKLVTTKIKKIYFNNIVLNVVKSDRGYFMSFFNAIAKK